MWSGASPQVSSKVHLQITRPPLETCINLLHVYITKSFPPTVAVFRYQCRQLIEVFKTVYQVRRKLWSSHTSKTPMAFHKKPSTEDADKEKREKEKSEDPGEGTSSMSEEAVPTPDRADTSKDKSKPKAKKGIDHFCHDFVRIDHV